jgi:hypothetical protein
MANPRGFILFSVLITLGVLIAVLVAGVRLAGMCGHVAALQKQERAQLDELYEAKKHVMGLISNGFAIKSFVLRDLPITITEQKTPDGRPLLLIASDRWSQTLVLNRYDNYWYFTDSSSRGMDAS